MVNESRQRRRAAKGVLLIAGLVAIAMLIFFLEDLLRAFEKNYTIMALVPDAPGIAPGTPVWVGGRRAGEVLRVAILPTTVDTLGRVAVTLELPTRVREQVRRDSRVRLTSVNFMSEAVVDIIPGTAAAPVLPEGDTLRLEFGLSAEELTERAARVRADLDTVLGTLGRLTPVAEARMADTRRIAAGLDGALVEVERLRVELASNPGLNRLREPEFQAALARARDNLAGLPAFIAGARERSGAGTAEVQAAMARLQLRTDTLSAQLAALTALMDESGGFLGRVQRDTALVRAMGAAQASLDSLMIEVRRNPLRFVF
jgi:phospholipid/cholesterol/gamma-HCH transport system substrate-binding protein